MANCFAVVQLISMSIVLLTCNIWECKITIIIERCRESTSWVKITLFIMKKRSDIFFFISVHSFGSDCSGLSAIIFPNRFVRSAKTSSGFFGLLVPGC